MLLGALAEDRILASKHGQKQPFQWKTAAFEASVEAKWRKYASRVPDQTHLSDSECFAILRDLLPDSLESEDTRDSLDSPTQAALGRRFQRIFGSGAESEALSKDDFKAFCDVIMLTRVA